MTQSELEQRVLALRDEFDRGFAAPPRTSSEGSLTLLAIRVGGLPYALRIGDVGSLVVDRRLMRLPSPQPALLGLTTLRGLIIAVYDLGALLGHPRTTPPRWLMLSSHAEPIGLAFDAFEGQLRVDASHIAAPSGGAQRAAHALFSQLVEIDGVARPIIETAAVIAMIEERLDPRRPSERSDET